MCVFEYSILIILNSNYLKIIYYDYFPWDMNWSLFSLRKNDIWWVLIAWHTTLAKGGLENKIKLMMC
jgi:hypothetical protein